MLTPLELAQAMFARIDAGDWPGVAALMTEDYVIHEPPVLPYGGDWNGQDALSRLFAHVMGYWDDPVVERRGLMGDEQHFVALLSFTMTSKLTGRRFTQPIAEVTRCEGGKMVETWVHYFDADEAAREAGPRRAEGEA